MLLSTRFSVSSPPAPSLSLVKHSQHPRPFACGFTGPKKKCIYGLTSTGSNSSDRIRSKVWCGQEKRETGKFTVQPEIMPKHVAVIMDGNRRWASEKGLAAEDGHEAGWEVVRKMTRFFEEMGVKVMTVFAFSTENWGRSKGEVESLMKIFGKAMGTGDNLRVSIITSKLPASLTEQIATVQKSSKTNHGLHQIGALNYGGRHDILEATISIAAKVQQGKMSPEEINEDSFAKELQTNCTEFPYPDLLIRTSGEKRLSNFMLWQMAHTELYFVDKCFPDMEKEDFMEALIAYQERKQRLDGHKYDF